MGEPQKDFDENIFFFTSLALLGIGGRIMKISDEDHEEENEGESTETAQLTVGPPVIVESTVTVIRQVPVETAPAFIQDDLPSYDSVFATAKNDREFHV